MSEPLRGEDWIASRQKRIFDVAAVVATSPLTVPAMLVGAAAFFAETRKNPLLLQKRQGQTDSTLDVPKLRTMNFSGDYSDSSRGPSDPRASRIGDILRTRAIDELPQAWPILVGRMSVVGHRPLLTVDVEKTLDVLSPKEQKDWLYSRSVVKPGWLSEFGNVSRSLDPNSEEYCRTRAMLDIEYLEKASYKTDKEIIKTGLAIGSTAFQAKDNIQVSATPHPDFTTEA